MKITNNMKRKLKNFDRAGLVWILIMLGWGTSGILAAMANSKGKKEVEKQAQRIEQMGQQFAKYIVSNIADVAQYADAPDSMVEQYKTDPQHMDAAMQQLVADSTEYANAIFRDAKCIWDDSKTRVMQINQRHLMETSVQLAQYRNAKAMAESQR